MKYDFSEHDRALESSPERRQLIAALSWLTKAQRERYLARDQLREGQASNAYRDGIVSNHARRLHLERLDELQKTYDKWRHEEEVAKFDVARLKDIVQTRKLEGRVAAHRQLTANLIDAARQLQDAVIANQQFRKLLAKDLLRFGPPLQLMAAYERGGEGWVDQMLPTIEAWLKEMERGDAYQLASKGLTPAKPRPQPAIV